MWTAFYYVDSIRLTYEYKSPGSQVHLIHHYPTCTVPILWAERIFGFLIYSTNIRHGMHLLVVWCGMVWC